MKLLILAEEGAVGAIMSRIALQSGWEVVVASTVENTGTLIRSSAIDVLLTEYLFSSSGSKLTGLDVVEKLRAEGIAIPVIIFTAYPELIDRARAETLQVLAILEKPLSIHELRITLNDAKKQVLAKSPPPQ